MVTALWLAVGGAIGTLARAGVSGMINSGGHHPWGTVTVNIFGSLVLGVLIGVWGYGPESTHQVAISIGLLGGFTTFSTFAMDTVHLWEEGRAGLAITSVTVSVVVGITAAVIGLLLGRAVAR
jgi:CrcB protein